MKTYQNGQDFVTRLNLLLDNELTPDAERAMLEEINKNPEYREMLAKEQSFREFVRSRVHRKTVSPSLSFPSRRKSTPLPTVEVCDRVRFSLAVSVLSNPA
ncbi:MAG: hypothetical protein IPN76_00145 [Saprospiraceae bacterium]|nr:hypothetical protein [Saprospiraceae bacterium]